VRGGIVAYANEVKVGELGVPDETIATHGAVSAEVAAAMAAGVRERLGTDVGVAVTGVAGPGGGSPEKPVGLVHFHVSAPGVESGREPSLPGDRDTIRARATVAALHLARAVLTRSRHQDE
jgi:nicotinamide-nucleotide amidase